MRRIFTFISALCVLQITAFAGGFGYLDVPHDYKYAGAIESLTDQGIVEGFKDGTFRPEKSLNRAELLKILDETFLQQGSDVINDLQNCFADVTYEKWYAPAVCKAKNQSLIAGFDDNTFRPGQVVTLAEALKMILVFSDKIDYPKYETELRKGQTWYQPMLNFASEKDLVPGEVKSGKANLNRGQMAELIYRIQNYQGDFEIEQSNFDPLNKELFDKPASVTLSVPFTSQAPYGNWSAPYDEACEEAAILMVQKYLEGQSGNIAKEDAKAAIIDLTNWVKDQSYGVDIGTNEMADLSANYYGRNYQIYSGDDVTIENIEKMLALGYPIILPFAGQQVNSKYYIAPGPPYHVAVLIGYDENYFYANDPGTQFGKNYAFDKTVLFNAIHDWTGSRKTVNEGEKALLILE